MSIYIYRYIQYVVICSTILGSGREREREHDPRRDRRSCFDATVKCCEIYIMQNNY